MGRGLGSFYVHRDHQASGLIVRERHVEHVGCRGRRRTSCFYVGREPRDLSLRRAPAGLAQGRALNQDMRYGRVSSSQAACDGHIRWCAIGECCGKSSGGD